MISSFALSFGIASTIFHYSPDFSLILGFIFGFIVKLIILPEEKIKLAIEELEKKKTVNNNFNNIVSSFNCNFNILYKIFMK